VIYYTERLWTKISKRKKACWQNSEETRYKLLDVLPVWSSSGMCLIFSELMCDNNQDSRVLPVPMWWTALLSYLSSPEQNQLLIINHNGRKNISVILAQCGLRPQYTATLFSDRVFQTPVLKTGLSWNVKGVRSPAYWLTVSCLLRVIWIYLP
jgi:hypothetical protein